MTESPQVFGKGSLEMNASMVGSDGYKHRATVCLSLCANPRTFAASKIALFAVINLNRQYPAKRVGCRA
jgi:hypothetical protein